MPEYLATITGQAVEYSFGGSLPYEFKEERRFDADNDAQAKEMAKERAGEIFKELLCVRNIKISSLEQVSQVL